MEINERVQLVRNTAGLTLRQFAQMLGISAASVSLIETAKNGISNQTIFSICREFGVNETWLRYGEGEMFSPASYEEELGRLVRRLFSQRPESFQRALVTTLLRFDPDGPEWQVLEQIYHRVAEEMEKGQTDETV